MLKYFMAWPSVVFDQRETRCATVAHRLLQDVEAEPEAGPASIETSNKDLENRQCEIRLSPEDLFPA
jgi:hypothetical protein